MTVEIEGIGKTKHIFVVSEIIIVSREYEYKPDSVTGKSHFYHIVVYISGNRFSISFLDDKDKCDEAYNKLQSSLNMFYQKDSIKEMIAKVIKEESK